MSFMSYFLIKNPEKMRKLRAEIDEITGGRPPTVEDLNKMHYLTGNSLAVTLFQQINN